MRRDWEVSGGRDEYGNFHPPDDNEMMRKLLAIREHLEDFGGIIKVAPKRVRIKDRDGNVLGYETWGLLFHYDSSAPAAELQEDEREPESEAPGDLTPEEIADHFPEAEAPAPEVEPEPEPALAE